MKRPAKTRRHQPRKSPAPAGLAHAFKLIAIDGYTSHASKAEANGAYPHALRIIDALHGVNINPKVKASGNDLLIEKELEAATQSMYPPIDADRDAPSNPNIVGMASFQVGFAVCWLLMMAVNGKDGAK